MHDYPTYEEIQGDPQYWLHGEPPITYYLLIGVSAWTSLEAYGWVKAGDQADFCSPRPRTYRSRFVGVTQHRGRWVAQWGPRGKTKGKAFPMTPEGELAAAWERARALGLSEPEQRPEGRVLTSAPDVRPINPRGVGAKAARGKRIA
jgi:hypothetical protein